MKFIYIKIIKTGKYQKIKTPIMKPKQYFTPPNAHVFNGKLIIKKSKNLMSYLLF